MVLTSASRSHKPSAFPSCLINPNTWRQFEKILLPRNAASRWQQGKIPPSPLTQRRQHIGSVFYQAKYIFSADNSDLYLAGDDGGRNILQSSEYAMARKLQGNIARGTTDPEIDSVTWIELGNNMAPLTLVANLTTWWHHLH